MPCEFPSLISHYNGNTGTRTEVDYDAMPEEDVVADLCQFEAAAAASDVTLLSWAPHPYNYR